MKEITITSKESGQRIDKYIRKLLNDAPLSYIYRLFRVKDIKVNGKKADISYILKENDIVRIFVTDDKLKEFSSSKPIEKIKGTLNIIYEDENILIINKPRGILIHGDEKEKRITLSNIVLNYLYEKGEYQPNNHSFIPSPCHRLDRNTSGIVVFGKNMESLQQLFDLFKEKNEIEKKYIALVKGIDINDGEINLPLLKDEKTGIVKVTSISNGGKKSLTKYTVIDRFKDCSLVLATLVTGRTHQLRVHFSSIKHPIIGDAKYGNFNINRQFEKKYNFKDQFLHAYQLSFKDLDGKLHYLSNKVFTCDLPKNEKHIIDLLKEE